jgi:nicotinamidase-related amidase
VYRSGLVTSPANSDDTHWGPSTSPINARYPTADEERTIVKIYPFETGRSLLYFDNTAAIEPLFPFKTPSRTVPYRDYETLELEGTALVSVGVQRGFDDERWGERNNPDAERHVAELLGAWRDAGLPVFHVKRDGRELDSPFRPGRPGSTFKPAAEPRHEEPVVETMVEGAFADTDLEERLRDTGVDRSVFAGFTAARAVSTAARTAANLGFQPLVVDDATVTFDREFDGTRYAAEQSHRLALAQLSGSFATVVETATLRAALESRG